MYSDLSMLKIWEEMELGAQKPSPCNPPFHNVLPLDGPYKGEGRRPPSSGHGPQVLAGGGPASPQPVGMGNSPRWRKGE